MTFKPTGCGSNSCKIAPPEGQGTNGPCTCHLRVPEYQRKIAEAERLLRAIEQSDTVCVPTECYYAPAEDVQRAILAIRHNTFENST